MSDSASTSTRRATGPAATGLVHRPLFKTRPTATVAEAFQKHIRQTGSPETFAQISTTRPPEDGRLVVLTEFHAEKAKRPRGDLAPCPICSPDAPQFLAGVLIWCEASAAIYAIGRDCGASLWRDGRLDQALSAFEREQARRSLEDRLFSQLPKVPALRVWIATHMPAATAADRLSRGFRKRSPKVYSLVKQAFDRNGQLPIREAPGDAAQPQPIALVGARFIRDTFGAESRLSRVDQDLSLLDFGEDELGCIDAIGGMTAPDQVKALKWLRIAQAETLKVFEHLADCTAFVSADNMARLGKWSELPGAPFRLMAYAERGRIKIFQYQDKSDWGDTLDGMNAPEPPPPLG